MNTLLEGAGGIGGRYGWTARKVYTLVERNPDFPAFKLGEGKKAKLYAYAEEIDAWISSRARRSIEARAKATLH